ncbi:MAG: 50S ribosomal protein L18 [DPANN group archaeon]|nr:50S ribosomal protein L18 [DPANN group archaeon]
MNSKHLSHFRRRIEGKTNYKKRLNLLISGKPRMVVRRSNTKMIVQIVTSVHGQDKTVVAVDSSFLAKIGWKGSLKNIPAAYLTGLQLAVLAKSNKVDNAILDIGLLTPTKGAVIFAVLKGAVDGGLEIPNSPDNIPSDERIVGTHIDAYRKTSIVKEFEKVKNKILAGSSVKSEKKESIKEESKSKK